MKRNYFLKGKISFRLSSRLECNAKHVIDERGRENGVCVCVYMCLYLHCTLLTRWRWQQHDINGLPHVRAKPFRKINFFCSLFFFAHKAAVWRFSSISAAIFIFYARPHRAHNTQKHTSTYSHRQQPRSMKRISLYQVATGDEEKIAVNKSVKKDMSAISASAVVRLYFFIQPRYLLARIYMLFLCGLFLCCCCLHLFACNFAFESLATLMCFGWLCARS